MTEYEKTFTDLFSQLTYSRNSWQVWEDLMAAISCAIANSTETDQQKAEARNKEYKGCIERLGGLEIPSKLCATIVNALEDNPDQDFLGKLYMLMGLGGHWKGQFFTPFTISRMMAEMDLSSEKVQEELESCGWFSINDPACGAGSTLIAAASVLRSQGINYQQCTAFIGCDIDRITAQMCYIQLSLLGCPGYVVVTDTLTNPLTGPVLLPEAKEDQEIWFTPMWSSFTWVLRRMKEGDRCVS